MNQKAGEKKKNQYLGHNGGELGLVKLAFAFEGALALVYLVEQYFRGNLTITLPTVDHLLFGVLLSQLLFIFNSELVSQTFKRDWRVFKDFFREMIFPIASKINLTSAFLVSLAAGIGEELFFRGFLQPKIGLVSASILFGLIHFVFNLKKYYLIAALYVAIGLIFGFVFELFESLWPVVIFHTFYDFTALMFFKKKIEAESLFAEKTSY